MLHSIVAFFLLVQLSSISHMPLYFPPHHCRVLVKPHGLLFAVAFFHWIFSLLCVWVVTDSCPTYFLCSLFSSLLFLHALFDKGVVDNPLGVITWTVLQYLTYHSNKRSVSHRHNMGVSVASKVLQCCSSFHLGRVCIFALHNNCLWHTFYSGAVTLKLLPLLCCISFFCLCVLVCVFSCQFATRQLSTIQLPNFLRRLKWKVQILVTSFTSAQFACVLRQHCFLSSLKSFQGSGSLPWLGTCALKPTQSSNGQRRIFSSPLQGSRDAVPFVLHLLSLWLPHQQCNKCAPLFFFFCQPCLDSLPDLSRICLCIYIWHTARKACRPPAVHCWIAVASLRCRVLACACSHLHCWAARLFVSCTLLALFFFLMGIIFAVFVLWRVTRMLKASYWCSGT